MLSASLNKTFHFLRFQSPGAIGRSLSSNPAIQLLAWPSGIRNEHVFNDSSVPETKKQNQQRTNGLLLRALSFGSIRVRTKFLNVKLTSIFVLILIYKHLGLIHHLSDTQWPIYF